MAGLRKHILFVIASLGPLFGTLWLPVAAIRQYSLPKKEDQKYIRRVYANQTVGQQINSANKIN
ncbi:hypothetical protein IH781_04205 [Patescibacteria group bacterium]|nr:hypothetical protein [Patescibacteria group bacterium]